MKLAAHALVLVTFVAAPILQVGVANAETATPSTPSAQDRAERLFQEGKALMGEERFREACPKFEASQKLDPATGTLLALALCHEGEGKIATAYREFREALPAVQADGRRDREQLVQTRIRELAPRIPRIVVDLERAAREDSSLRVTLDGEPIQAFNTDLFVDPGEHVLMATGNGKPWRTKVQVPEQALRRLVVPPLEPLPTNEPSASNTPGVPPTRDRHGPGGRGRAHGGRGCRVRRDCDPEEQRSEVALCPGGLRRRTSGWSQPRRERGRHRIDGRHFHWPGGARGRRHLVAHVEAGTVRDGEPRFRPRGRDLGGREVLNARPLVVPLALNQHP